MRKVGNCRNLDWVRAGRHPCGREQRPNWRLRPHIAVIVGYVHGTLTGEARNSSLGILPLAGPREFVAETLNGDP